MNINIISRGKGKSAVEAAAYRAAEKLTNEYDGQLHDYTAKQGLVYDAILLPDNAPYEYGYRSDLWNAVEHSERAKNAQLAREVRLVLPVELTLEQNINLVNQYVQKNFVDKGMCADICIHDTGTGNPHAHIMLTMRPLEHDGTWGAKSKMEYVLDDNGERIKLPSDRPKTKRVNLTNWDDRANADMWRESWAGYMNAYLEHYGHDVRVDHRSYARQGLEQIPTIHLGPVAHGLEKRGIATERGNINRAINEANAQLRNIDKQIHEIQNPPAPQMIIDLQNSIKAQDSPGYANWAKLFNLQQMAQTLIYIQESGFTDMESLQAAHHGAKVEQTELQNQLGEIRDKIKGLTKQRTQADTYRKTLDVYKKYNAPGQFKKFKEDFYNRNKEDIEKHKTAKAYLFDRLKLKEFPLIKKLSEDIANLRTGEKELQTALKSARDNVHALSKAEHNACMLLGYRELESQNKIPAIPLSGMRFIKPYEYEFAKAQKRGETEAYLQSLYMDIDCAEFIHNKHEQSGINLTAIHNIFTTYGKQRVEDVIAHMINNSPDKYPDYAEWASSKSGIAASEPTYKTHQAFQYAPDNLFVQKVIEVADRMQSIIFQRDENGNRFVDDSGNPITKWSWALPLEAAEHRRRGGDLNWDRDLTLAEKMSLAQTKADEQNRNQPQRTTPKPKRSNHHEL